MIVPADERGVLRLFTLDMPAERAKFLREPGAAAQALGTTSLDHEQIEVFPITDLTGLGLRGYLAEGYDIPQAQLDDDAARLNALAGWVMLVRSAAFGGQATTLSPGPGVRLFATYGEPSPDWTATPIPTESAKPYSGTRPPPSAIRHKSRRVGASIFGVVMALIVFGVLWLILG